MATISERKNKRGEVISYTMRVYRGYDITGKRLKPYTSTWKPAPGMTAKQIQKELNRQAVQFEEQCKNGLSGSATKIKLVNFCFQYLEIKKESLSPLTFQTYKRTIDRFIIPAMGHLNLQEIRPAHIQEFIKQLNNTPCTERNGKVQFTEGLDDIKKLSPSSVKRYLTVLQSIFKQALKLGLIENNPADISRLSVQKVLSPKIEIFTKQEATQMIESLQYEALQFQVLIQLAILTGARRGELIALKFSDFNPDTMKVLIERTAIKVTGQKTIIKPPKDYEIRTVSITPYMFELVGLLKQEKEEEAQKLGTYWKGDEWLFTQVNGEIMNPQTPTKQFEKFLKKNNYTHKKFHSLRHTSATLLLYGGVNIQEVQRRLGHASQSTTAIYLHSVIEADEQATNVLQDMLITHKQNREIKQA